MRWLSFFAVLSLLLVVPAFAAPATLSGAVATSLTLDEATLKALPATNLDITFKTAKGTETGHYTGVLLWDLIGKAGLVNASGKNTALRHTLLITGADGYAVALAEGELDPDFAGKTVIIAYQGDNAGVSFDHLRLLVPGDAHGGRSVSDVVSIEVK